MDPSTAAALPDGIIECWGNLYEPPPTPISGVTVHPDGEIFYVWSDIAALSADGGDCVLLTDGALVCMSDVPSWRADGRTPPNGVFKFIGDGCAVRETGEVVCWDNYFNVLADPPEGSFDFVSVGESHTCGIVPGGEVACWGADGEGQATPPSGAFRSVNVGASHTCGLRVDDAVSCWGDDTACQASPPPGRVQVGQCRRPTYVRGQERWISGLLGRTRRLRQSNAARW